MSSLLFAFGFQSVGRMLSAFTLASAATFNIVPNAKKERGKRHYFFKIVRMETTPFATLRKPYITMRLENQQCGRIITRHTNNQSN
jgi:hypothetical protein